MTNQEKIEAIRAKCIAVNPEIVELKFGCILKELNQDWKYTGWKKTERFNIWNNDTGFGSSMFYEKELNQDWKYIGGKKTERFNIWNDDTGFGSGMLYEFEILGRPIRLADVLLAKGDSQSEDYGIDTQGRLIYLWNLRVDDLTLQDEACIDFIHELVNTHEKL